MGDLFDMLWGGRVIIQQASYALLLILALRFGAGPERTTAAVLALMPVVDALYHAVLSASPVYATIDLGHLAIDVCVGVAVAVIALNANRMYTLWIGAFQILAIESHLIRMVTAKVSGIAYMTMQVAPSYFQIVLLAVGIWCHHRRQMKHGDYRAWRNSLPRSQAAVPAT